MKFLLIYPRWPKLSGQTEFHLPPHGPVVFAAALPPDVEVEFVDENVEAIDFDAQADLVGISMMLSSQVKRGWAIADEFRRRGLKVICGGIGTQLHAEETQAHADAVFIGEAEGRMEQVLDDFRQGRLRPTYDYLDSPAPVELVGPARRSLLKRDLYNYKGVRMVDLFHASRGCRFRCYPCAVNYLGGRSFRPRPFDKVVEELAGIDNNRLFVVDNSLAQSKAWELELFRQMIPLKKKWCSHPIENDEEVLDLAAQAGAWYVYQAVFDTSDFIRRRIERYHAHGIAVEGTILLGLDEHTEDDIKRLVDFLLEIELDLAEFTVLTPFPHTRSRNDLVKEDRILTSDWDLYTADKVVYRPRHMSPDRLLELYHWAWDAFYKDEPQTYKMYKLLQKVVGKEMADGTFVPRRTELADKRFGRPASPGKSG
ncbi:MAG: cobalamin-dependent protein [Deltaproteobacteria bacterium]|nr:cobalamin-dependent protein [Deltaproteobacteria bacterium]